MKLKNLRNEWLQILIVIVPFCAVALLWDKLPDWIPIHWNARGQVDDYARKGFGTLFLPLMNLVVALLTSLIPLIDPKLQNYDLEMRKSLWKTVKMIRLFTTGFLSLMSLAIYGFALGWLGPESNFSYAVYIGLGVLFILLGNVMSKLRPNYFVGIRTPWTLESKEVWVKTHRFCGRLMVAGGFVLVLFCLIVPLEQFAFFVLLPVAGLLSLVPVLYSFLIYRKSRMA